LSKKINFAFARSRVRAFARSRVRAFARLDRVAHDSRPQLAPDSELEFQTYEQMHYGRTGNSPDGLIQVRDVRGQSFGRALDQFGVAPNQAHRLPRVRKLSDQLRPDCTTRSKNRLHAVSLSMQAAIGTPMAAESRLTLNGISSQVRFWLGRVLPDD
jgi:hypothetical protein